MSLLVYTWIQLVYADLPLQSQLWGGQTAVSRFSSKNRM